MKCLNTYLLAVMMVSSVTVFGQIYTEEVIDFESWEGGANGWTSGGTSSSWALGDPDASVIDTAATGTQAWVTNLSGNYNTYESSWVMSPTYDFTGLDPQFVSFYVNWSTFTGWEGVVLEISTDDGSNWSKVGAFGDPDWSNTEVVQSLNGEHGWSGGFNIDTFEPDGNESGGWIFAEHSLTGLANETTVRFRFYFGGYAYADQQEVRDQLGVGIDDFKLVNTRTDHGTAYFEDFDTDDGGWVSDDWSWGDGVHISQDYSGVGKAWYGQILIGQIYLYSPFVKLANLHEELFITFARSLSQTKYNIEYRIDHYGEWIEMENLAEGFLDWSIFGGPNGSGIQGNEVVQFRIGVDGSSGPNFEVGFDEVYISTESIKSKFIEFTIPGQYGQSVINIENSTVTFYRSENLELDNLISTFDVDGGMVKIGTVEQVSGVTATNYSSPVIFNITSENGYFSQDWTIFTQIASKNIQLSQPSAVQGQSIKIYGSYFDPIPANNNVTFGGVSAVVTEANEKSLTVTVPHNITGPTQVVVTNVNGGSFNLTNFSVLENRPDDPRSLAKLNSVKTLIGDPPYRYVHKVKAVDLDNDGDYDILYITRGEVGWLSNDGVGNFTDEGSIYTYSPELVNSNDYDGAQNDLEISDLNSDGKMDFLLKTNESYDLGNGVILYGGFTYSFINQGNGVFNKIKVEDFNTTGVDIKVIDLDEDGYLDLIGGNTPHIKLSDGAGNFIVGPNAGNSPGGLVDGGLRDYYQLSHTQNYGYIGVADFSGDGVLDIVGNSYFDDKIWVFENNSDLTFTSKLLGENINAPTTIVPLDFDKDGDIDLLTQLDLDKVIVLSENQGNGDFQLQPTTGIVEEEFGYYELLGAGDLNQDGFPDLVTMSNGMYTWYSNPNGADFNESIVDFNNGPYLGNYIYFLDMADFDNDGDLDIVSTFANVEGGGQIVMNFNQYTGNEITSFEVTGQIGPTIIDSVTGTITVSVDAQANRSAIIPSFTNSYKSTVTINGVVQESGLTSNDFSSAQVYTVTADNGDVKSWTVNIEPKISITNILPNHAIEGQEVLIYGAGFSSINEENIVTIDGIQANVTSSTSNLLRIQVPAYNSDSWGNVSLKVVSPTGSTFDYTNFVLLRDDQQEGAFNYSAIDAAASAPAFTLTSDLDNDGDKDIITFSTNSGILSYYLNENNQFTKVDIGSSNAGLFTGASIADIDQNGFEDIVTQQEIFFNKGGLSFDKRAYDNIFFESPLLDMNSDGTVDAMGNMQLNDGEGNFTGISNPALYDIEKTNPNNTIFYKYKYYDLDLDGDPDVLRHYYEVISATFEIVPGTGKVDWLENDGTGNLTTQPVLFDADQNVYSLDIDDFDNNGTIDIILFGEVDTKGKIYSNQSSDFSSASFVDQGIVNEQAYSSNYTIADINADGLKDFVSGTGSGFMNDGNFSFSEIPVANGNFNSGNVNSIVFDDLDGDGDLDVVNSSNDNNLISFLENVNTEKVFYTLSVGGQTLDLEIKEDSLIGYMDNFVSINTIIPNFTLPPQSSASSTEIGQWESGVSEISKTRDSQIVTVTAEDGSTKEYVLQLYFIPDVVDSPQPNEITTSSSRMDISGTNLDATGYQIFYSTTEEFFSYSYILGKYTGIDNPEISELLPGTQYFIIIRLTSDAGRSPQVRTNFWTLPGPPEPSSGIITRNEIQVTWPEVTGASHYFMDVSNNGFLSNIPGYNNLRVNSTDTTVSTLLIGNEYQVRVRAVNVEGGLSVNSEILETSTLPQIGSWKDPSNVSSQSFTLGWNESVGAENYLIDLSIDTFKTYVTDYEKLQVTGLLTSVEGLLPATQYQARIYPQNISGTPPESDTLHVLTVSEVPDSVYFSDVNQSSAVVSWHPVNTAIDYYLQLSTDNFSSTVFGFSPKIVSDTSLLISNLSVGTEYQLRISSRNNAGQSPYSQSFKFSTLLGTPSLTLSSVDQTSFFLTWNNIDKTDSFEIDVSQDEFITYLEGFEALRTSQLFLEVNDLVPATSYQVRIRAWNSIGASPSSQTLEVLTIPATPEVISIDSIDQSSAYLSWPYVSDVDNYYLEVSSNNFSSFLRGYGPKILSDTTAKLTGLAPGTNYQLQVSSSNSSGQSLFSPEANFYTVPNEPLARDASSVTDSSFRANWNSVIGATYYQLEVSKDNFESLVADTTLSFALPVQISGLKNDTLYTYRVRAGNVNGVSGYSNTIALFTLIGDINSKPTDISLDNQTVAENQPAGSIVASLLTSDLDFEDTHSYSFVEGTGDDGNQAFEISRNQLLTSYSFNFEDIASYSIRVKTDDGNGEYYEKSFVINVRNVNDPPSEILLSDTIIEAFSSVNTVVGTLNALDEDHTTHGYQVKNEAAAEVFSVFGDELRNRVVFTNEKDSVIQLVLLAADASGATVEDTFDILIKEFVDTDPPVISSVTDPGEFEAGASPVTISAQVEDFEVAKVNFLFKDLTQEEFNSTPMELNGTVYSSAISEEMLNSVGGLFYITAEDASGNFGITQEYSIALSYPEEVSPEVETDENRFGGEVSDYQILSVPYVFAGNDNRVNVIFDEYADDSYGNEWRLLRYNNSTSLLEDMTGSNQINLGEGYFFVARNQREIKVGNATINVQDPFTLQLEPGWNLIGNPYTIDINWQEVLSVNNVEGVGALRVLDPNNLTGWPESTILQKFTGAYVQAIEGATLELSYSYSAENGRMSSEVVQPSYDWLLPLTVSVGEMSSQGSVGMHPRAENTVDVMDQLTLPRWIKYLSISFDHPEYPYGNLSRDIVKDTSQYVWEFEVQSNQIGNATLSWPQGIELENIKLLDLSSGAMIDMLNKQTHTFNLSNNNSFRLLYSEDKSENFTEHQLILGDIFPNPAREHVQVLFHLPVADEPYEVVLHFTDISGRTVYKVNQVFTGGNHMISVDRSSFEGTGVLLVDIRIKGEHQELNRTTKLIIQK